MKFRAGLHAKDLALLSGVVGCFEKVGPSVLMYLSERTLKLASPKLGSDEVRVFCDIQQEKLFTDYRIESLANNSILFEVGLHNLVKAFHSARTALYVKMKLAKRGGQPCICLEARAMEVDLLHEIPIRVMRAADIQYYTPPDVPPPRVQLELPYNKTLRGVIDRFKAMDRFCFVEGDMNGALTLRVENDTVNVQTFYTNLIPRLTEAMEIEDEEAGGVPPQARACSIKLDTRKLSQALHYLNIKYDSAMCCMVEDSYFILMVNLPGHCGALTYYLPVYLQ